jgi:Asp-tRNA(Asn)/Glu-tRNA(Gln) amidotransferase C subunit
MEDNNDYQKALDTAHAEMTTLLVQHQAIEKRIAKLRQIIHTLASLNELTDDDDEPSQLEIAARAQLAEVTRSDMALSDLVREVLKASGEPMTAIQVRRGMRRLVIDFDQKYTSPLGVIHKALKRLKEKGEVKPGTTADGGTTYQWVGQQQLLTRRQLRLAKEAAEREASGRKNFLDRYSEKKD